MADEWDDDDFGTFESADATSPVTQEPPSATSTATPTWLMEAQQSTQVFDNASADNIPVNKDVTENKVTEQQHSTIGNSQDENLTGEATNLFSQSDWKPFSSTSENANTKFEVLSTSMDDGIANEIAAASAFVGDNVFTHVFNLSSSQQNTSRKASDNQAAPPAEIEAVKAEQSKERDMILELQNKLDTAIAMKEQTEESLKDLQAELTRTINDSKEQRERKKAEHEAEMKQLKEEQEMRVFQLKDESQKTMQLLTEEYATLSTQSKDQQKNEYEKDLEEVVEKCLDLLKQQHSMLSEKLNEERSSQNKEISDTVEHCRTKLRDFVEKQCSTTAEVCSKTKDEMETFLKEEIEKEIERQREIDNKSKREAMEELTNSFKLQMEESLRQERDRQSDAIKLAVEEARRMAIDALEQDKKKMKIAQDRHLMALQLLLASSQEHLRHLADDMPSHLSRKEAEE